MSIALPPGPLYGHYSFAQKLYTVHSGSPDIVLNTPSPVEAPVLDSNVMIPRFRQPRYLSMQFPYLLFIPKRYPWHNPLFKTLDFPRHKLPIVQDDGKFCLHPAVTEEWMSLETCLRAVGKEMMELAPQRGLPRLVNSWFFPGRFKFLRKYSTEEAARTSAWYSIDNFLPLLGYVTMGLWFMRLWEADSFARDEVPLDWRSLVMKKTAVHGSFLDYLEQAVNWNEERVGTLHLIQSPQVWHSEEREGRAIIESLLSSILHSTFPIPIYLSWGEIPNEISMFDVPKPFQEFVPDVNELKSLASPSGEMKFSRWAIDTRTSFWYRDPYTPPASTRAPLPPSNKSSATVAALAPFPPLPKHSGQKENETIHAFFSRRKAANEKTIVKENVTEKQRRMQRADNAKRSGLSKKAHVFVWETLDGHYVRQQITRGEAEDYFSDYPPSQRRFDPIHNEWDLCPLFQNNDPIFGEGFDVPDDDSDDGYDETENHPIFPQNIDMASRLHNMEVEVKEPHPQDLQRASIEDVTMGEDFDLAMDYEDPGPDFTEVSIPKHDLADASKRCVNSVYRKFGLVPRMEQPEYETISGGLLGTLEKRFGFLMVQSPDTFVALHPPTKHLDTKHLANVLGMTDIDNQLASQKGLSNILGIFFGQCLQARSVNDIDKRLLDFHQPSLVIRQCSPFEISRESLKSMRKPSEHCVYYVLRKSGSGIGSEVLLFPRATDLVEVLRQEWGPDIKDVVRHLLARGIPFWLAYMSAEIMPASKTPPSLILRPEGFKADITSGLGFRPHGYKFDEHDYQAYTTQCNLQFLHTPRARIALQYGGIIARRARSEVPDDDFFRRFDDQIYDVGDCLWDETSQHSYCSSNSNRSGPRLSGAAFDICLELLLLSISAFLHEFHGAKPSMRPENHQGAPRVRCLRPRNFNLSDSMLSGTAFSNHLEPSIARREGANAHARVRRHPSHAKVLQQLGWLYHQDGSSFQNQDLAIQYLTKSLEADPSDAQSWYLLGRAYMAGQKYNKAYEAYQQAVYRDGRNPTFCTVTRSTHIPRAIRINPYISEVWFDLGSLYESCNNQISDAIDAYARASELDPSNPVISQRLALLKNAQATGGAVMPPPGLTGPPLLLQSTSQRPVFRTDSRGPPSEISLPPPSQVGAGRSSPGPFRGGPPPPVILDEKPAPPPSRPPAADSCGRDPQQAPAPPRVVLYAPPAFGVHVPASHNSRIRSPPPPFPPYPSSSRGQPSGPGQPQRLPHTFPAHEQIHTGEPPEMGWERRPPPAEHVRNWAPREHHACCPRHSGSGSEYPAHAQPSQSQPQAGF
ncbi:hypothetical protein DFH07DRAFT_972607 [Mycena maculata]|uniref:TPR-like protein n=1 Tax=Mycena maculata TaxID=230809 RepID=A0AAD7MK44_9AGAR|nr:hypothetical protein DFH07DRAFT_972607 [Mycena maculata]